MATGYTSATITYAWPDVDESTSDTEDWIEIEQPDVETAPASRFGDFATSSGLGLSLTNLMTHFSSYMSSCEGDGCLTVEIRVHKSREDLNYAIMASYGELSDRYNHSGSDVYSTLMEGDDAVEIGRLIEGAIEVEFEGKIYDINGNELNIADLSWSYNATSGELVFNKKIVGSVRLKYTAKYDAYTLTITPREATGADDESDEDLYASSIVVTWAGDPVTHDVDLPDLDGDCASTTTVINPDDDDEDDEKCYERTIKVDPCTKEIVSDELVEVACPDESSDDGADDGGSTTTSSG